MRGFATYCGVLVFLKLSKVLKDLEKFTIFQVFPFNMVDIKTATAYGISHKTGNPKHFL